MDGVKLRDTHTSTLHKIALSSHSQNRDREQKEKIFALILVVSIFYVLLNLYVVRGRAWHVDKKSSLKKDKTENF